MAAQTISKVIDRFFFLSNIENRALDVEMEMYYFLPKESAISKTQYHIKMLQSITPRNLITFEFMSFLTVRFMIVELRWGCAYTSIVKGTTVILCKNKAPPSVYCVTSRQ